jgi:hypothetical protein
MSVTVGSISHRDWSHLVVETRCAELNAHCATLLQSFSRSMASVRGQSKLRGSPPSAHQPEHTFVVGGAVWSVIAVLCTSVVLGLWSNGIALSGGLRSYTICSRSSSIYTVDASRPQVECFVVQGTQILRIGIFQLLSRLSPAMTTGSKRTSGCFPTNLCSGY